MNKTFRTRVVRNRLGILVGSLVGATLLVTPARGTWYAENVANGSDIVMMDVRWPWWPESTYFANFNFAINPGGITGYGGFAIGAPTLPTDHRPNLDPALQGALRPGSVWSFWGANSAGEPVRIVSTSQYAYPHQYIGEGASGSLGGPVWPFIRTEHWYRMMIRVWQPAGEKNPTYSYMGRWVKDIQNGEWHLYGIARLPICGTSFSGNAGFLEDFGNGGRSVRSMDRRLGYCRKDGKWLKSDTVTYDVPPFKGKYDTYWVVNIKPEGDHEYLAMELSSNSALLPLQLTGKTLELGKKTSFTVKQPPAPKLDPCLVTDAKAESNGKQIAVSWQIPKGSAPQLAYKVEVFGNAKCQGAPSLVREERMPTVQTVLLDAPIAKPTVRLTVTDIFDQSASPIVLPASRPHPAVKAAVKDAAIGLQYQLIHKATDRNLNVLYPPDKVSPDSLNERHIWVGLDELKSGQRVQQGYARGFDTDLRGEFESGYAFQFQGLLRAPTSGLYLLHMRGSDGYDIAVDGKVALAWDGLHGPTERVALLNLNKGDHAVSVRYFVDRSPAPFFKLEWEGPGIPRQEIPTEALLHRKTESTPDFQLRATSVGKGLGEAEVTVDPHGHSIQRVQLFLGKLQIAESAKATVSYKGPMLEGGNTLWARATYDTDHTIDSDRRKIDIAEAPVEGWALSAAAEAGAQQGILQTGPDAFSFIGEGESVLSRKVKGDFTLTCRVDQFAGAHGEPVNPSSWAGLSVREDASKNNYGWGREFGIMQTGGEGLRMTPNYSDLATTRVSDFELPKDQPWLRVVRRGNEWTAWSSADGKVWRLGSLYLIPTRETMDAGVVFRALPQGARAYFQAAISHITLVEGASPESAVPRPQPARDTGGARLTGVVLSQSDPKVVVVRSSAAGLLRSDDGGATWRPCNGSSGAGAFNCVRSVAISPTNPNEMLRAFGQTNADGKFEGGLARSTDAGATWTELPFPGDFDGVGPSALCGEVVAFDPLQPTTFYAGTESKGFFVSRDAGATWKAIGASGERVTAVVLNRWGRGENGQSQLHVLTCSDDWMTVLGRGKPTQLTNRATSADYLSNDGGATLRKTCERTDLGYLNAAFDKGAWPEELPYATTLGVAKAMNHGELSYLFPVEKGLDSLSPVTALATSGLPDRNNGLALTQPLTPTSPNTISASEESAFDWTQHPLKGDLPSGGMIAIAGEFREGHLWWFLATDGLYKSEDGGTTLKKVLDQLGGSVQR